MRECPFEARLSAYYDNELDAQTSDRLQAHLADCQECSSGLRSLRQMSRLIADAPTRATSRIGMARLHAAADAASRRGTVFPMARALLAIAASVLIITSAWLVEMPGRSMATPMADFRPADELDTLASGGKIIPPYGVLPDDKSARDTELADRRFGQEMIDNFAQGSGYEKQHR